MAIRTNAIAAPSSVPLNAMTATSASRNITAIPGLNIGHQWLENSAYGSFERDYNYYTGWYNPSQWVMQDKPGVYAVYWMNPVEFITTYFRFGGDWLREHDYYFQTGASRQGDVVGLHAGGGLRFGLTKHMGLDFNAGYLLSPGNNKGRGDSWGASAGVVFYFD